MKTDPHYWGPDQDGDWVVTMLGDPALHFAVADEKKARAIVAAFEQRIRAGVRDQAADTRLALAVAVAKVEADAVAGLRYIEQRYGRLEGVGWDRVFDAHAALTGKALSTPAAEPEGDCHVCGYDCAGANPPPIYCPVRDRAALRPEPKEDEA